MARRKSKRRRSWSLRWPVTRTARHPAKRLTRRRSRAVDRTRARPWFEIALLACETLALVAAAIVGVLWWRSPNANYEPIAFLILLFGGSAIELLRRQMIEPSVQDELKQISRRMSELVAHVQGQQANVAPVATQAASAAPANPLADRIGQLVAVRSELLERLQTLAAQRGLSTDTTDPLLLLQSLHLPNPFEQGIAQVLEFTTNLPSKESVEIVNAHWVLEMASAGRTFFNVIGKSEATMTGAASDPRAGRW